MHIWTDTFIYPIAVFLPAVVAVLLAVPRLRRVLIVLGPLTALPALWLAFTADTGTQVTVPWLFFRARFGLDPTAQGFLAFTSLVWLAAAVFATGYIKKDDPQRGRFWAGFLLAMSGNFGLIMASDVFSFYFLFALMSFSSFALIVHSGAADARRAGSVYIWLVVIGEAFVFSALLMAAHAGGSVSVTELAKGVAASPDRNLILALAFLGFGIKAGALPLHVWLPLAHPVAPTPASAVLSGCMIKAGLLGWLRIFPLGVIALPGWGILLIVLGLSAAVAAVLVGLTQDKPKTVLAYSSISQMGVMTTALGLGLLVPEKGPKIWQVIIIYAAHHAVAKGALFLSVGTAEMRIKGVAARIGHLVGLVLPAAAVMGAPLTGGALAKGGLKYCAAAVAKTAPVAAPVKFLISLSAVGTVLIMVRFLYLIWPRRHADTAPRVSTAAHLSWTLLVIAVALLYGWINFLPGLPVSIKQGDPGLSLSSQWPLLVGLAISAWVILSKFRRPFSFPEGDVLKVYVRVLTASREAALAVTGKLAEAQQRLRVRVSDIFFAAIDKAKVIETTALRLTAWPVFGVVFMTLLVMFFIVMKL
ncbi:MAG: hypothetical protein KC897_00950 [Candidatus Omnitrophica bacterium]|nr:hypothetical protein [Candidatus Omnitrophota bacterium]MCB9720164.1 hypothetical protein [Candidatus Omnitrophota bacterium]